jgi:general secretion pathway protein D
MACLAVLLLGGMGTDESTSAPSSSEAHDTGIPIERIIESVGSRAGKKTFVDPRVRANVQLIGRDPSNITYPEFLTLLQVHGFIAVENNGYLRVLPDANARQSPVPLLTGGQTYPDAQVVTEVINVKNISAAQLVPILRPLIPQMGHFAAYPCTNSLLIVDYYANVRRIEALVKTMDVGTPIKPMSCDPESLNSHRESPPPHHD